MLSHLSEDIAAAPFVSRHPRDVEVIPKSRDFH
jgi:hypothetical protein